MPPAETPPDLNIPSSSNTVEVYIIDTTAHVGITTTAFVEPAIPGHERLSAACYAFLISHNNPDSPSKYDTMLFDLGVRKDVENSPKSIVERIKNNVEVTVEKDVLHILDEHGTNANNVGAIIWSHYHWVRSSFSIQ